MEQPATFWMMEPLRKYATFAGRARRAEYWWFVLAYIVVLVIAAAIDGVLGTGGQFGVGGLVYYGVAIAAFLPSLAVGIRRLHDRDKSGWWYLLGLVPLVGAIVLLVWFCSRGTVGPNRFGPDPLDPAGDLDAVFS